MTEFHNFLSRASIDHEPGIFSEFCHGLTSKPPVSADQEASPQNLVFLAAVTVITVVTVVVFPTFTAVAVAAALAAFAVVAVVATLAVVALVLARLIVPGRYACRRVF